MDPNLKFLMFSHWIEDQSEKIDILKNHGYLIGSFINPEAVSKILGSGSKHFESTEEDFEETSRLIFEHNNMEEKKEQSKRKKKKKKLIRA